MTANVELRDRVAVVSAATAKDFADALAGFSNDWSVVSHSHSAQTREPSSGSAFKVLPRVVEEWWTAVLQRTPPAAGATLR